MYIDINIHEMHSIERYVCQTNVIKKLVDYIKHKFLEYACFSQSSKNYYVYRGVVSKF